MHNCAVFFFRLWKSSTLYQNPALHLSPLFLHYRSPRWRWEWYCTAEEIASKSPVEDNDSQHWTCKLNPCTCVRGCIMMDRRKRLDVCMYAASTHTHAEKSYCPFVVSICAHVKSIRTCRHPPAASIYNGVQGDQSLHSSSVAAHDWIIRSSSSPSASSAPSAALCSITLLRPIRLNAM